MIHTLWTAMRALTTDVQCGVCRFWYDDRYNHNCTPC